MFTGLIEMTGRVHHAKRAGERLRLAVALPGRPAGLEIGESIAIDGVCLTVVAAKKNIVEFDAVGETLRRTTLGVLKPGTRVNVERALRAGDALGGHIVQGHVDAVGTVKSITEGGGDRLFRFVAPKPLMPEIAPKGSITIDGISLTVVDVLRDGFTVTIIPHTLEVTTLGGRGTGDSVNLETDVFAKYVRRATEALRAR